MACSGQWKGSTHKLLIPFSGRAASVTNITNRGGTSSELETCQREDLRRRRAGLLAWEKLTTMRPGMLKYLFEIVTHRVKHQRVPPATANALDVGDSLAGFGPRTNARRRFVIESQMLECPRAAVGFVARTLREICLVIGIGVGTHDEVAVGLFRVCLRTRSSFRDLNHYLHFPPALKPWANSPW
jgi:hypothetical protein